MEHRPWTGVHVKQVHVTQCTSANEIASIANIIGYLNGVRETAK